MTGAPVTSGSTGAQLRHELPRALALPDVDLGVDLHEEVAARADELPAEVLGDVR